MNRLTLFILICLAASCSKIDPEQKTDYEFHDDFRYRYFTNNDTIYLTPCSDEYFIRFETEHKEEVMLNLRQRFQILTGPYEDEYMFVDFEIPDDIKNSSYVIVKGMGNITTVPHLIYYNHLYFNGSGRSVGKSNSLKVLYEFKQADELLKTILQHAEELKTHPIKENIIHGTRFGTIVELTIACTNNSAGNPVEIANWFVEEAGFLDYPEGGFQNTGSKGTY